MILLRLCLLWVVLWSGLMGAEIRIVGSDLLGDALKTALRDFAQSSDQVTVVKLEGSYTGWQALQAGEADIGLLSFSPGEPLPADSYHTAPLAYYTARVVVSADSPLSQVDFAQLGSVFGNQEGSGGKYLHDLGATGEVASRSVQPYTWVHTPSLTLELFRHVVLRDRPFNPGVITVTSESELGKKLQANVGGIAVVTQLSMDTRDLRTLPLAGEQGAVAFPPNAEAMYRGDYPLSWPLQVVFRRDQVKRLYPVLRFLLGPEVAASLQKAQLTPVSAGTRADLLFGLESL